MMTDKHYFYKGLTRIAIFVLFTAAYADTQVVHLSFTTATQMTSIVKPLLSEGETVGGDKNILILKATTNRLNELQKIIAELDKPGKTFLINVRRQLDEAHGDETIIATTKRIKNTEDSQAIKVLEGEEAFITLGEEKPVVTSVVDASTNLNGVTGKTQGVQIDYQSTESGFWVSPHLLGDGSVRVSIRMQQQKFKNSNDIAQSNLQTSLIVPQNQWVSVGGVSLHHGQKENVFAVRKDNGVAQQLLIKVEVLE